MAHIMRIDEYYNKENSSQAGDIFCMLAIDNEEYPTFEDVFKKMHDDYLMKGVIDQKDYDYVKNNYAEIFAEYLNENFFEYAVNKKDAHILCEIAGITDEDYWSNYSENITLLISKAKREWSKMDNEEKIDVFYSAKA